AVLIKDVAEAQEDLQEEAKGPAKKIALSDDGEWSKAAIGFTKGQGMSVEDIYFKELNGVEYAYVNKFVKGQPTVGLLPQLKQIITSMTFGKNMRWADYDLRYVRPIKWIVALFGQEVIPFSITNVETGNTSNGHRFLGEPTVIHSPSEYETLLESQSVIVDPVKRKEMILSQLRTIEEEQSWVIPVDSDLLEEVNNLVEYPTALFGSFNKEFLELPEEVLITSMKEHQRYFPVKTKEGALLPHFVTVRNGNERSLETVSKGNEKVLRARLADADFFYKEDQKTDIATYLKKLPSIVYHQKIGTLDEKVSRIRRITNAVSDLAGTSEEIKSKADRAAEICKFDLVTQMVYEFPELQGVMGEKYALQKGEDPAVARAINEHYQPRHADDQTPASPVGALVSLGDKLDTIISSFAVGMIPTGSQDPHALRRQATGIVQTLIDLKWGASLEDLLRRGIEIVKADGIGEKNEEELLTELISFFKLRIKHLLQEKQVRYDIIDSILEGPVGSVPFLIERAEVIMSHKGDEGFKEAVEALGRVINIAKKAETTVEVNEALFENEAEKELYKRVQAVESKWDEEISSEERYHLLTGLQPAIENYFDSTMVMAEDLAVKNNRLNQMKKLSNLILDFAHFNTIIVK
ncbi:MAG TPA: glycine--tRNA ligase subunit beta, partial [Chondromyces sp.]|nr:glycine--tRNA ligase subunit beta [Chondromyces sp.]